MIQGSKSLKNPYYYTKSSVIFKISSTNNDNDVCGKHYKTFDTEEKEFNKGQYYIDVHGDTKIANADGTYTASKGTDSEEATITANKAVFPYYEIGYSFEEDGETKTGTILYWLDKFIEVGDKMTSSKFAKKTVHTDSGDESELEYDKYFKSLLLEDISNSVKAGKSKEQIVEEYGMFIVGSEVMINGLEATITSVSNNVKITENDILDVIKAVIKEYGDNLLKSYSKTCSVTIS